MGLSKCIKMSIRSCKIPDVLLVRVVYGSAGPLALSANCDEGRSQDFVWKATGREQPLKPTEMQGAKCSAASRFVRCVNPVPKKRCVQVLQNARSLSYGAVFPPQKGTSLTVNHVRFSGAEIGNLAKGTKCIRVLFK